MNYPEPGEIYRPYFGGEPRRVLCVAHQTESNVTLVVVHPVPEDGTFLAIPLDTFMGKVQSEGRTVQRFEKVKRR